MRNISDEIYEAMREEKRELSSGEILQRFFKIDTENLSAAKRIVDPILGGDLRFRRRGEDRWTAVKILTVEEVPLAEAPFVLFHIDDAARVQQAILTEDNREDERFSFLLLRGAAVEGSGRIIEYLREMERYVFVPYDSKSLGQLKKVYRCISPLPPEIRTASVRALIHALFPKKRLETWDDIIRELGVINFYSSHSLSKVQTLRYTFEHIVNAALERGIRLTGELLSLSRERRKGVDFSLYGFDRSFLKDIPNSPGVYLFYNSAREVIYVGKTANLRIRIRSYFLRTGESEEKIEGILENINTIDYRVLGSDLEALIEEYRLIEQYSPRFNTKIKVPQRVVEVPDRILIPKSSIEGKMKLYFLSNSSPLIELDYNGERSDPLVENILKRGAGRKGYVFDPLKVIAISYMKRYEKNLNIVDIDRYRGNRDIQRVLRHHWQDLCEGVWEKSLYI